MTIKLALTGTGYISKIHADSAKKISDVEIVAVVNHKQESMAEFAKAYDIPRQFGSVDELVKAGGVDALVVSTPNYLHASQTISALNAGLHVLVEKPMAMDAVEAEEMMVVSQKANKVLMVAHCWRFHEEVVWLKDQVAANVLGKVLRTKSYGVHLNWGPAGWFTQKAAAGGGAMADMGIHALDTARFVMGNPLPVSVYARIGTYYKDMDVDDTGVILVNWDNGAVSYLESGWWQVHRDGEEATTQVYGQKGFGSVFPTYLDLPSEDRQEVKKVDPGLKQDNENYWMHMYDVQMQHFIDCIKEGKKPIASAEIGWINMKVVDAAYRSAASGEVEHL